MSPGDPSTQYQDTSLASPVLSLDLQFYSKLLPLIMILELSLTNTNSAKLHGNVKVTVRALWRDSEQTCANCTLSHAGHFAMQRLDINS